MQTKPNSGASVNANFIQIQITNHKDMLDAKQMDDGVDDDDGTDHMNDFSS